MTVAETALPNVRAGTLAWPAALAVATVVGSLAIACMMPFVALAVVVATTMPLRNAAATVSAIWLANQALGFTLLGFPPTAYAYGWGLALGCASLVAMLAARAVVPRQGELIVTRLVGAFALAFGSYEALLFGFATAVGGLDMFAPSVVMQIAANDAGWFAGLLTLRLALTGAAPHWFGSAPALRFA